MKLFNTIAYHSTKQKNLLEFEDFTSESKAKTGEGAMIHGFGLYLQEDGGLNVENYKDRLDTETTTIIITDSNGIHSYTTEHKKNQGYENCKWIDENGNEFSDENEYISGIAANYPSVEYRIEDSIYYCDKEIERLNHDINEYNDSFAKEQLEKVLKGKKIWEDFKEYVNSIKYDVKNESSGNTTQYEVEIPDDFNFIDEDTWIKDNNEKVVSIIKNIIRGLTESQIQIIAENSNEEDFILRKGKWNDGKSIWDALEMDVVNGTTGYSFYRNIIRLVVAPQVSYDDENIWMPEVSKYLKDHGIDGMSYYGHSDGYCWVIFNCKDLKIIGETK